MPQANQTPKERTSNGLQPSRDGLQPSRDGLQPKSDGLQPKSDGLQLVCLPRTSPTFAFFGFHPTSAAWDALGADLTQQQLFMFLCNVILSLEFSSFFRSFSLLGWRPSLLGWRPLLLDVLSLDTSFLGLCHLCHFTGPSGSCQVVNVARDEAKLMPGVQLKLSAKSLSS